MASKRAEESIHIVYVCKHEGNIMYIGEGLPGREKHITSGVSSVYKANEYHFSGIVVSTEIVARGLTKEESERLEAELIESHNPPWNSRGKVLKGWATNTNGPFSGTIDHQKIKRWFDRDFRRKGNRKLTRFHDFLLVVLSLCDHNGHLEISPQRMSYLTGGRVSSKDIYSIYKGISFKWMSRWCSVEPIDGFKCYRIKLSELFMSAGEVQ